MSGTDKAPCRHGIHIAALAMFFFTATVSPALAYVGPGLGAGVIATILGVLGAVGLALVAVIYYPIKRMMKKKKKPTAAGDPPSKQ